ncbi:D-alanyl-D-alanine carboxypeptidase/D-alanyl-D-alanine-endopeptidase [Shewanella algae]|uniref:D-alanyl-D-alanine carboxypeptidase/D-alanyl-D-alanine endopeptidase n=1 Tax=Shewanella algae TaxID=38313 RepID=UPI001AAD6C55|nr:D-alanyl-D-alanine carboxypeptidase/D-alanyl-D-alanine-endopeptidase [Shewanella algae]MBO2561151.1 D-alanyl-D-alanine carboxypeptidase/D-alanyl-D-alanine-endopeptidase [Shewanella algae]
MPQLSLQGLARPLLLLSAMALSSSLKADNTSLDDLLNLITPASSQTAVWIEDLQSGEQLLSHNSETLMIPASTQKLLTAVTATELLGEEFRYHTSILSTGSPKSGVLKGDLYLLFSGDPTLTRRDLTELFKRVSEAGISQVQGNLILIGETHEQLRAPGWVWDDLGICYAAPVSSYVINQNCVHGKLEPTLASDKAKISAPVYLPVKLTTNAIFDKGHKQSFCELQLDRLPGNHFHFSGCFPGSQVLPLALAVNDPSQYAIDSVAGIIKGKLSIKGKILTSNQLPASSRVVASHASDALPELLETMLLESDNLIADSLLKRLGKHYYGDGASFSAGAKAIREVLAEKGVVLERAQLIDGSGLSRYNLLNARQLAQLLRLIADTPDYQWLMHKLPVSGHSGTLKYRKRYANKPLKGRVWAKTGSMQGVVNLAGYVTDDSDKQVPRYLFVILENGLSPQSKELEAAPFATLLLQGLTDYRANSRAEGQLAAKEQDKPKPTQQEKAQTELNVSAR